MKNLWKTVLSWLGIGRHHHHAQPGSLRGAGGCIPEPLSWQSVNGRISVNDRVFHLKGVNWYGFETPTNSLHGLDHRSVDDLFLFLQKNKFNALRMPFSLKFMLAYDEVVTGFNFQDTDFFGMTRRQLVNRVIEKAADYQILVMLDMHRLDDSDGIPPLWYDETYSEEDFIRGWDIALGDLKSHWNVFAVDLKNEPSGDASWGAGDVETDWNLAAERIGRHLLETHSDWQGLVFVEGTKWSSDLRNVTEHPIDFGRPEWNNRLVFSPHQYGPSVAYLTMYSDASFPRNMPELWTSHWGFVQEATGRAVIVGEWGGRYEGQDKIWQDAFVDYLLSMCLSNQFTWDLNPDSADTKGLLKDDWITPETQKLEVVARVQPDPSVLYKDPSSNQICLTPGSFANAKCGA